MFTLYNHAKIAPLPNFNNSQGNFRFWPKTIILVLKKVPDNWFFPKSTYKMIFMSDTLVTKPYWLVNLYVDQTISNLDYYLFVCFKLNLVLGHWGYYLHSFFFFKLFIFCPSHSLFLKRKKDTRKAGRRHSYSYHLRLGSVKENKNIKLNYEEKKTMPRVRGHTTHASTDSRYGLGFPLLYLELPLEREGYNAIPHGL